MTYPEWESSVPDEIRADALWSVKAYRLALFIGDLSWYDATTLLDDKRTVSLSDQLYRSVGSISANIAEGYSRGTGKDRARFYQYALGSAREARDWYYKGRHVLKQEVVQHRIALSVHIIRLLLTMIPQQRGDVVSEAESEYAVDMQDLLENVPLP